MVNPTIIPDIDPTDYGNEPGKGPLRAGGKSGDLPATANNRPDTRSKAAQAQVPAMEVCRHLYAGGQAVTDEGQRYLPKAPGESSSDYLIRLRRSVFHNFYRQTVNGLVGLIYAKDPVLGEDMPGAIREHWENIDLRGTHGDVFCREITEDAMVAGHAAILVEFPTTDGTLTRAEEQAIRPYWVPIQKEQIMSWRTGALDGAVVLTQVVIEMTKLVADGMFGEKAKNEYLVIQRNISAPDEPPTWQMMEVTKDNRVVVTNRGTYTNQTDIPLAEVPTSGSYDRFESHPPLFDLAMLNVAHYQMWSDYATSIHKTCVPVLVLFGVTLPQGESVVVGPNTVLTFENPDADAKYVSHSGQQLDSVKGALDDLKADIGTMGLAMLSPQKRTAETAEAKRIDKSQSDSALAATARAVQDAVEQALTFHARYMRIDSGGSVAINRDFEGLVLEAPVMQAYAALVNAGFPRRVVLRALQDGGRIPDDEDIDALELEMEANAMAATLMRDLAATPFGGEDEA